MTETDLDLTPLVVTLAFESPEPRSNDSMVIERSKLFTKMNVLRFEQHSDIFSITQTS